MNKICIHTHTHTCTCIDVHVCIQICTYNIHTYIYTYMYIYTRTCMYTNMYIQHTYINTYIRIFMYRERDKTWRIRASLQDYDNIIFLKKNILKPGAYGQVYRTQRRPCLDPVRLSLSAPVFFLFFFKSLDPVRLPLSAPVFFFVI